MSAWASPRLLDATAPENESGLWLYEPYYGLSEKPFSLSTDPRFLYQSPSHTPVFQEVLAGIRRREGLVVLTGEIGMGKTTLCRSVLGTLDRKTFSAFVPDPFVTREDLLKILLVEFGVVSIDDIVRGRLQGASRAELSYPLYEFLRSLEPLDAFAVVLLDEAQNLPVPLLEEIRILSDLEGARKLLQVVLIGQPELSNALRLPHMRQMRQRVTTHCELQPLTREGVYGYVSHRLMIAGGMADRVHFTGDALDLVFEASGGVPRVINRLCDRTLQRGHRARAESIGPELVRAAIDDLQLDPPAPQSMTQASAAAAPPAPAALTAVAEPPVEAPTTAELSAIAFFGVEQTSPASADDPHTLFSPPPTVLPGATAAPVDPRADRVSTSDRQRAPRVRHVEAPGAGRGRGAAAAALVVLGVLSGMTMAVYWVWAGPLVTGQTVVPAVKRPSARIAAPLPAVLPPAIDLNDVPTEPVQPAEEPSDENEPSEPFIAAPAALPAVPATQTLWAVQVGTFSDDARASALVGQLAARGLTAFKTVSMRGGATLHVVLVGPYPSRAAAHAGLESAAQIPGVDRPILQPVPPATAALR